ncbi:MAG: hypothetical protein ABFD12_04270 [Syntrophorhabdus sp.]
MKKVLKFLIRNANLLNVILVAIILAFAAGIGLTYVRMRHAYAIPRTKEIAPAAESPQAPTPAKMPSDYAMIGEENLFHPNRNIPVDKKTEVPRPEIVLYGTLIDRDRIAFIEDRKNPVITPGRGTRQRVVRKGEVVSGYTVTDIMNDRITLARGDDNFTVMLSQPDKRKPADGSGGPAPQAPMPATPGMTGPGGEPPPPTAPASRPGVTGRRTPQAPKPPANTVPVQPRPGTAVPQTQPPVRSAPPE